MPLTPNLYSQSNERTNRINKASLSLPFLDKSHSPSQPKQMQCKSIPETQLNEIYITILKMGCSGQGPPFLALCQKGSVSNPVPNPRAQYGLLNAKELLVTFGA